MARKSDIKQSLYNVQKSRVEEVLGLLRIDRDGERRRVAIGMEKRGHPTLMVLIALSSLAHLFFILIYPSSYDLKIWITAANALVSGRNFYCEALASNAFFGYPPLFAQAFLFPLALAIPPSNEFNFLLALRLVFLTFNMGTGILLWEMLGSKRPLATLWFLNPLVLGVTQYQFDSIPTFFLLLAIYALRGSAVMSSWLLGIGASLKVYPGLLLPMVIGRSRGSRGIIIASLAAISIPLISVMPFLKSECFWSLAFFLHINVGSPLMRRYAFPIAYAAILLLAYKRRLDPVKAGISIFSSFNFFYFFSLYPFPPLQYSIPLVPLLILDMSRPSSRLAKYLVYNAVWALASAVRYKATIYRYLPMPIPLELFGPLSFYCLMASLVATCVLALLGPARALERSS